MDIRSFQLYCGNHYLADLSSVFSTRQPPFGADAVTEWSLSKKPRTAEWGRGGVRAGGVMSRRPVLKFRAFPWYKRCMLLPFTSITFYSIPRTMSRHSSSRAAAPVIVLYDSPGTRAQTWVPNIWRIRLILNYKRLPYRTVWVEFPDVEATLRSIGAPPSSRRADGRAVYTLPVIVDPTRNAQTPTILSNTNNIAEYLEATYPARPVFPEGSRALQTLFVHYIQEIFAKPLLPIMVPISHDRLPERTQSHFHGASRAGTPIPGSSHPLPPGAAREHAWQLVKEQFDFLAIVLDKNVGDGDGVVAQGNRVSYADFALCSVLLWVEQMAPHDGWARIRDWNGGRWARLRRRCQDYMDLL